MIESRGADDSQSPAASVVSSRSVTPRLSDLSIADPMMGGFADEGVLQWEGFSVTESGASVEREQNASKARREERRDEESGEEDKKRKARPASGPELLPPSTDISPVALKPKRKKTTTKKVSPPVPDSDATPEPPDPPAAPAPNYGNHSLGTLQAEVKHFGFKPSKSRSVMIEQLNEVWLALEARKKQPKKKKGTAKKKTAVEDAPVEELESIGERMRKLIIADDLIYGKVLRYEVGAFPLILLDSDRHC